MESTPKIYSRSQEQELLQEKTEGQHRGRGKLNISGVFSEATVTMAENCVQIKALKSILNNIQSWSTIVRKAWLDPARQNNK